ncbi:unnamed protein product [Haemonchus placei]|uniref:ZP domain-containing protein n=1 Tax=Haemonchus placei TaxID=6290 RepID=A0A0N4X4Q2_HAEPC|nr:unnamed protein product [Haemonchus placei]
MLLIIIAKMEFLTCNYWIESPVGTVIQVRLLDFTTGLSVDGCKYSVVEIKTNKDQTLTGYGCWINPSIVHKSCSDNDVQQALQIQDCSRIPIWYVLFFLTKYFKLVY